MRRFVPPAIAWSTSLVRSSFVRSSLVYLTACGPTAGSPDAGAAQDACSNCGTPDAADAAMVVDASPLVDANANTASGSYVYYFGDFETESLFQVARIDLGSGVREILAIAGLAGGSQITGLAIAPNNSAIVVAGKNGAGDAPELQLYPANGDGAPTVLFAAAGSTRNISTPVFSPDGAWLAFLTDSELLGAMALHVVPTDASAAAKRVSLPPVSSTQDVATFTWAHDSVNIAFVGDLVSSNVDALWTVNATATSPSVKEIVTSAELGSRDVGQGIEFDSSNRLYFRSDHELADNQFRLYRSALDGTARTQLSGTALTNGAGEAAIGNFRISPDGSTIAFASDSPTTDLYQIYVLNLATSAPALVSNLSTTAPPSGLRGPNFFEPMQWSPDGSMLTMTADWPRGSDIDNDFGVFVLPTSGAPGGARLARPQVASGDVVFPRFAADNSRIIFGGDLLVSNHSELFGTGNFSAEDQPAASIRIQEVPTAGAVEGFVLSN